MVCSISERETPKGWPWRGRIEFRNCYMKYSPEDLPVLKNLNLVLESGWKVNYDLLQTLDLTVRTKYCYFRNLLFRLVFIHFVNTNIIDVIEIIMSRKLSVQ